MTAVRPTAQPQIRWGGGAFEPTSMRVTARSGSEPVTSATSGRSTFAVRNNPSASPAPASTSSTSLRNPSARLPDRVGEAERHHVAAVEPVDPSQERGRERRRRRLDHDRAVAPGVLDHVPFVGPRNDADLVAAAAVKALDEVVHHRSAGDRLNLLRRAQRLQSRRVPGRRNQADDHRRAASRNAWPYHS